MIGVVAAIALYVYISVLAAAMFTRAARFPLDAPASMIAPTYEEVSFTTSDGLVLRGWLFAGTRDRAAILVHGLDGNRLDGNVPVARVLTKAGYSVLMFDLRGRGESDGDRLSLGQYEALDVAAAIDLLVDRGFRLDDIALVGGSMGATTVIKAVELRPGVGPIVAESGFSDARTIIAENGTGLPHLFDVGIFTAAKALFGLDVDQADARAVVRRYADHPFFFIHCEDDTLVAVHHAHDLMAVAGLGSALWTPAGCSHVGASIAYPDEYRTRVLGFLDEHMP